MAEGSPARYVAWVAAVSLVFASAPLRGGAPVHQSEDVFIYLDSVDGVPASEVTIPLTLFFTGAQQAPIERLEARICLSEEFVQFERVDLGSAAEAAETRVSVAREANASDCAPLVLAFEFAKPPQRGTLAHLIFRIDEGAPVGRRVKVHSAYTVAGYSGKSPTIEPSESEIAIVEKIVIPACFFYMH